MTKAEKIKYDQLLNENLELKRQNHRYMCDIGDYRDIIAEIVHEWESEKYSETKLRMGNPLYTWINELVKLYYQKKLTCDL